MQLRQASIGLIPVLSSFGSGLYDGPPDPAVKESCSTAATEVIADFPAPWDLHLQHRAVPYPHRLTALEHVAYRRAE